MLSGPIPYETRKAYTYKAMDELFIEDKKYISSKQAAKITGYAKDYVGQLCREGRVPARLVGRSWYVLEGAIQDHRFGNPSNETTEEPIKNSNKTSIESTWDSPRYEATSLESLADLKDTSTTHEKDKEEVISTEPSQQLQDSWQTWFTRMAEERKIEPVPAEEAVQEERKEEDEIMEEIEEDTEVDVPIHAIYQTLPTRELSAPLEHDITPIASYEEALKKQQVRLDSKKVAMKIRVASSALAVMAAVVAIIGSGYLDRYLVSTNPAHIIAGVSFYNK